MLIGYARVSTWAQNLTLQTDALTAAGCERVCSDKASGAKADRSGLSEALSVARRGDTLVLWKLDRLGRSMKGLVELAADLATRGIELRSLTDGIDTATPTGRLLFHILASIAEKERELIRERTMAELLAAGRKNGPGRGRKSVLTPKKEGHGYEAARYGGSSPGRGRGDRRLGRNLLQAFSGWWRRAGPLKTRYLRIVPFGGHGRRLTTLEALSGRLQAT